MADPIAAVMAYLTADPSVSALVGGRVFGGELPKAQAASMPQHCVVLRPAGGGAYARQGQNWADTRVDVDCYGTTPLDAWQLHLAVRAALRSLTRVVEGDCLLHWARVSSDGTTLRDPETNWPLAFASYQVLASGIAE